MFSVHILYDYTVFNHHGQEPGDLFLLALVRFTFVMGIVGVYLSITLYHFSMILMTEPIPISGMGFSSQ